jgi:acetyl esterase/lipase
MPVIDKRQLMRATLATSAAALLPVPGGAAQAMIATNVDPLSLVDPDLVALARRIPKFDLTAAMLPTARKAPANWPLLPAPAVQPTETRTPGPAGTPDVRLVVFDGAPGVAGRPAFLHMHGGGYVSGAAGGGLPQSIAQNHGCYVVSVDYRLAPETRFPGALEDCYAALGWLYANADRLGIDKNRVAIGGESAGGGLAATLAIAARDRGEFTIAYQLLIYPMLDDRTGSRAIPSHIGQYIISRASTKFCWEQLLGSEARRPPKGAVPAREAKLADLPPAFIGVGAIDLFVEEDIEYARRLIDQGVSTELFIVPGAFHGFDMLAPQSAPAKRFGAVWNAALARALSRSSTAN